MRFAVLADIHGNLSALEAVLEDLQRHAVDGIMVAGDLIGGAQPLETLDLLRSTASWMIRGNGENYYLDYDSGWAPDSWQWSEQWASMRWLYRRLPKSTLEYLASLPEQCVLNFPEIPNLRLVHGSPQHLTSFVLPEHDPQSLAAYKEAGHLIAKHKTAGLEETIRQLEESVLVCGHSHIPWTYREHGQLVLNAGSVGQALNGDPRSICHSLAA